MKSEISHYQASEVHCLTRSIHNLWPWHPAICITLLVRSLSICHTYEDDNYTRGVYITKINSGEG